VWSNARDDSYAVAVADDDDDDDAAAAAAVDVVDDADCGEDCDDAAGLDSIEHCDCDEWQAVAVPDADVELGNATVVIATPYAVYVDENATAVVLDARLSLHVADGHGDADATMARYARYAG